MAFGNMQGAIQAYSHVTHLVNTIDLGFNLQASADAARYTPNQSTTGSGTLNLEPNLRAVVGDALAGMGIQWVRRTEVWAVSRQSCLRRTPPSLLLGSPRGVLVTRRHFRDRLTEFIGRAQILGRTATQWAGDSQSL